MPDSNMEFPNSLSIAVPAQLHLNRNISCFQPFLWQQDGGDKTPRFREILPNIPPPSTPEAIKLPQIDLITEVNCASLELDPDLVDVSTFSREEDLPDLVVPIYSGVLHQSCMRTAQISGDGVKMEHSSDWVAHYTPPPMLNPCRKGVGLFVNLFPGLTTSYAAFTSRVSLNSYNGSGAGFSKVSPQPFTMAPQINIGPEFQVELPAVQEKSLAVLEPHRGNLVWRPWGELAEDTDVQQRVESLLNMASSSALPGGGTNQELALHCLFEANGDILAALEMLLLKSPWRSKTHPLADYHYTGSDLWTSRERKVFNKAFLLHKKDFHLIYRAIKTKGLAQCVEYYYLYKKILKLSKKRRPLSWVKEEAWSNPRLKSDSEPISCMQPVEMQCLDGGYSPCIPVTGNFPCKVCGKMFYKIKSRNAHMKIHRQHEDWREKGTTHATTTTTVYTESMLDKPAVGTLALYGHWEHRENQEQFQTIPVSITCTSLPALYGDDPKLGYG
ncbi:transcriptional-regulating factor 1 [Latimeria chalumnae]|uniref:transcriptional-regulating factor 1 n=1 Tax=Latimeria chalumnae TaxID=7897 RepID=UPI0003C11A78